MVNVRKAPTPIINTPKKPDVVDTYDPKGGEFNVIKQYGNGSTNGRSEETSAAQG